ncbi:MAG TPA: 2-phospho-L-lactate transferase [Acidimicrobiia bacterium]|nr:2-phospho-L-lactate transferase [Acidimicrobiia bacterium]
MKVVLLSGGVGGARLARGLAAVSDLELTVVVNIGDDERVYGLDVSPDIDTVIYTMAGKEGPHGWGLSNDTFTVMDALDGLPIDTAFRIGDRDAATNLFRTDRLAAGWSLTWVTTALASAFGVGADILPASDDPVRTKVRVADGSWLGFQEYFVARRHADDVEDIRFEGAAFSHPAPGVVEAITRATAVVIGPSNPILSIWPILAVPGIPEAISARQKVIGVSPLIGGTALKGPAHRILSSLGFPAGNLGVNQSYGGLLTDLFVDQSDADDANLNLPPRVHVTDIRIPDLDASTRLAYEILGAL